MRTELGSVALDQVVTWGESRFFPGSGVDVANPVNVPLFQQPTGTLRELRKPVGMLWGTAQLTPKFIIEAYYQYDWEESDLPAVGTYFSSNDASPAGGEFIQAEGFGNQFGITVQTILCSFNDSKIALHYAKYNAKVPSFGFSWSPAMELCHWLLRARYCQAKA